MFCEKCGANIPYGFRECPGCGRLIPASVQIMSIQNDMQGGKTFSSEGGKGDRVEAQVHGKLIQLEKELAKTSAMMREIQKKQRKGQLLQEISSIMSGVFLVIALLTFIRVGAIRSAIPTSEDLDSSIRYFDEKISELASSEILEREGLRGDIGNLSAQTSTINGTVNNIAETVAKQAETVESLFNAIVLLIPGVQENYIQLIEDGRIYEEERTQELIRLGQEYEQVREQLRLQEQRLINTETQVINSESIEPTEPPEIISDENAQNTDGVQTEDSGTEEESLDLH